MSSERAQSAEYAEVCEREDCGFEGPIYYGFAGTVSNAPFSFSSTGPVPDQPIRLCHDHALAAFGVSFFTPPPPGMRCHDDGEGWCHHGTCVECVYRPGQTP